MRLSWAVMVNNTQISLHLVDRHVNHSGAHDPRHSMRTATSVYPKAPTQSHETMVSTRDTRTKILDQTSQGPMFCTIQTMEASVEICSSNYVVTHRPCGQSSLLRFGLSVLS
jgi:hypothetical protein